MALPDGGVRLVRDGRLLLDAGAMAEGDLVDRVAAPVRVVDRVDARADGDDDAGAVAGADDRVLRVGGTVDEVPRAEWALLALDDQERLAGNDEEVLLVGLPVVHRHRLSRPEHLDVDPELGEVLLPFQIAEGAAARDVVPARRTSIQDVPAVSAGDEPVLGLFEGRLRNHAAEPATCTR